MVYQSRVEFDEPPGTYGQLEAIPAWSPSPRTGWGADSSPPAQGGVSARATGRQKPTIGGLLLWKDTENYLHLDMGATGERDILFGGYLGNQDVVIGRGRLPLDASKRAFLRLERVGNRVHALCGADGESWLTAGHAVFPVEGPVQVGVYAIGNIDRIVYHGAYPDGTAIRFESFQLWGM